SSVDFFIFLFSLLRLLSSTLFPYTTLFRSGSDGMGLQHARGVRHDLPDRLRHLSPAVRRAPDRDGVFERDDPHRLRAGNRPAATDRKSTRLNSSHRTISYAVFCLKKKKELQ